MHNIKELRVLNQLTQAELAKQVGMTQAQICKIEKGERALKAEEVLLFSRALSVTAVEILKESI
jgi:transcriptional regulator with XRE-family HTH domain